MAALGNLFREDIYCRLCIVAFQELMQHPFSLYVFAIGF